MLMTTLADIKANNPPEEFWLAASELMRGEGVQDDAPFPVSAIGKLNNHNWLCWIGCLFDDTNGLKAYRQFAINCANRVRYLMGDQRSIDALDAAQDYLGGKVSKDEMSNSAVYAHAVMYSVTDIATSFGYYAAAAAASAVSAAYAVSAAFTAHAAYAAAVCAVRATYYADDNVTYHREAPVKCEMLQELMTMLDAYEPEVSKC